MLSDPAYVIDGGVTDDLFAGQDAVGKKALCESLNREAKKKQTAGKTTGFNAITVKTK